MTIVPTCGCQIQIYEMYRSFGSLLSFRLYEFVERHVIIKLPQITVDQQRRTLKYKVTRYTSLVLLVTYGLFYFRNILFGIYLSRIYYMLSYIRYVCLDKLWS